ncbi:unnamed protein product [Arabidopsis thaliana]|uniref:Uncharacterized protein n=1 Tax=Arabidopsis thaliana TaxID=3702 RepID=A0A654FZ44_ARATH|nr:unnamed protein product [Arabidopsis thaliana]
MKACWSSWLDVFSNEVFNLDGFSGKSRCLSDSDFVGAMREGEHFSLNSNGEVIRYISSRDCTP